MRAQEGDRIDLLLDLRAGSMAVAKNGKLLGVMQDSGLGGTGVEYRWAVALRSLGDSARIDAVPAAEVEALVRAREAHVVQRERERPAREAERERERLASLARSTREQDLGLPAGTRLRVQGHISDGIYERWERRTFGANVHFINFGDGVQQVALKGLRFSLLPPRAVDVRRVAGMADVEAADGSGAQVPETIPPDSFDLLISDMFANTKLLANVRTSDAVGELKTKLGLLHCGPEADALRVVLVDDSSDPPKQIDLEIEMRTLEEYGVGRNSKLMWQAQDPADAKQRRDAREEERLRDATAAEAELVRAAKAKHEAELRQATCWTCLVVFGGVVSQAGWWSLYRDLGLWGGVIGIPLLLMGFLGFERCAGGHSPGWDARDVWARFICYAIVGLVATMVSALACPAMGTVPAPVLDDAGVIQVQWVSPEAAQQLLAEQEFALTAAPDCTDTCGQEKGQNPRKKDRFCSDGGLGSDSNYCPLGSDTADCGCRSGTTVADWLPLPELGRAYGWGDRFGHESCGVAVVLASFLLLSLLVAAFIVHMELARMRRLKRVRRTSDGRTGVAQAWPRRVRTATPQDHIIVRPRRRDDIIVRWDDDGTESDWEAAGDFETLSFEAHVVARFDAP
jgi:hypothetical protein